MLPTFSLISPDTNALLSLPNFFRHWPKSSKNLLSCFPLSCHSQGHKHSLMHTSRYLFFPWCIPVTIHPLCSFAPSHICEETYIAHSFFPLPYSVHVHFTPPNPFPSQLLSTITSVRTSMHGTLSEVFQHYLQHKAFSVLNISMTSLLFHSSLKPFVLTHATLRSSPLLLLSPF